MEKAVIYLRVSTKDQIEDSQLQPCKKYCEEKNWEVIGFFKDHGKSAYKKKYRKDYEKVIELVRNKEIQHIVVWALDRWSRKGVQDIQEVTRFLDSYGVKIHSVHESELDRINTDTDMGFLVKQLLIGVIASQAKEESRLKGERVKISQKFQDAVRNGTVGRQPISQEVEIKVIELLKEDKTYKEIRREVKISDLSIARIKNSAKL